MLGAPFTLPSGDRASFLGYFDFAQLVDVGDTLYIEATPNKVIRLTANGSDAETHSRARAAMSEIMEMLS